MSETKTFEDLFLSSSKEEQLKIKELNILLVTDIHMNSGYLEKLKEWQIENKYICDYIFCTGDFLKLHYPETNNQNIIPKAEADLSSIIAYLENISLNVLYVCGNHDPKTVFSDNVPSLTVKSLNLHQNFKKISNDLYVFGLGGSVPALESNGNLKDGDFKPYLDVSNKVIWEGFPYNDFNDISNTNYEVSDSIYKKDLEYAYDKLKTEIAENNTTEKIKIILLTHNGPFYSSTNVRSYKDKCVYMGSKQLQEFMKHKDDIFINIHGHNHSSGLVNFDDKTIINVGALTEGKFGCLKLKRDFAGEWQINKLEFNNL